MDPTPLTDTSHSHVFVITNSEIHGGIRIAALPILRRKRGELGDGPLGFIRAN